MKKKTTILSASILMASLAASGAAMAQADFAAIEAAAKAEGRLIIYSSIHDSEMQAAIPAFEKHYPEIRVESIRLPSSQLFSRFIGELDAGVIQADFLASGSSALYQQRPELFVELTPDNVPNLPADPLVKAENDHYAVFQIDVQVATYNTNLVTQADLETHLATWEGLADPRWKGKIALVTPAGSPNQVSFLMVLRDAYGPEWFTKFAANEYEIVATASAGSQQVAAGAYELLVPTIAVQSAAVRAEHAPVALYQPGPPAHAPAQGMAVALNSPHPNAALLFLNWKLSPEGQQMTCDFGAIPVMPVAGSCDNVLPAEYIQAKDVIDAADQNEVFGLVGVQP